MTYVVAGVSGQTGRVVAETLLAQGKSVRVIVRDAAKGQPWQAKGASVAVADLGDAAGLSQALRGAEGAYLLIPPNMATPKFTAYQHATADSIVAALQATEVPHVVLLSSIAAHRPDGTGPIKGMYYAEAKLRSLQNTRSTFLRASYFMENLGASLSQLGQGLLTSFIPGDYSFEMVATADIGAAAAGLLVEGASKTNVVDLAGPRRSFNDVAAVLSKLLGKPIQVAVAPTSVIATTFQSFGFQPELANLYQEMIEGMLSGHVAFEPGQRKLTGPTDLEPVLKKLLAS
jgi:uncharacterized protein YbjT (DUF2867 family)